MATVPYTPIEDGQEADMQLFNSRFLALHNAINGGLDANNLADNAVTGPKIASDAVTTSKIVNKAVTAAKMEDQPAWTSLSYINGGSAWNDAAYGTGGQYYKDSLGRVHFRGLVGGNAGATISVLPVGFRPAIRLLIAVTTSPGTGRIDIHPDGSIIIAVGQASGGWWSLNNVSFKAEA